MEREIQKAIKILKEGGIVIFPTDTSFGMGCRMNNLKAVEKLFKIRKRPKDKATPVLVNSIEMAQNYLEPIQKRVKEELIEKYWPGALTIILSCNKDRVSKLVRGGGDTLGVRMPNNRIILSLINGVGVPILGPSANFSGAKTPYSFEDLDRNLMDSVDYVISGGCIFKSPSTVIDCSRKEWKIIREGPIKITL